MSSVVIAGDTSGSVTLSAPSVAGTTTLTLPSTSGNVLTSASSLTSSQLPTGSVLQVVSATKTDTASFTSSTFADVTGLSVSITPRSASSKFLIIVNVYGGWQNAVSKIGGRLVRNSTAICIGDAAGSRTSVSGSAYWATSSFGAVSIGVNYLDSPATTSSITYKWQASSMDNAGTVTINRAADSDSDSISGEE